MESAKQCDKTGRILGTANRTQEAMFNMEIASYSAVERESARLDVSVGQYIVVSCISEFPKQIYINVVC